MVISLAGELVLLAYDNRGDAGLDGTRLLYGLGGALLLDLALARRVDFVDGRVVVSDPTPVGHPLLDAALGRMAADGRTRRPKDWIVELGRGASGCSGGSCAPAC